MKFSLLILILLLNISAFAETETTPSLIQSHALMNFTGTFINQGVCTADCGNCCTGLKVTEESNGFTANVKGLDENFVQYLNDSKHRVRGYFFKSKGSCDMNECTFFKVTDVNRPEAGEVIPQYSSENQQVTMPRLLVNDSRYYEVTLDQPYNIVDLTKIMQQSESCSNEEEQRKCETGLTCISYFGIAGVNGPEFSSCEIRCQSNSDCPSNQQCTTIADGPGQVCR